MTNKATVLFIFLLLSFSFNTFAAKPAEVYVLIDVSGSMKQNDPNGLRTPALKLMINLLPEGHKAGIWLFSEQAKTLVEPGLVNAQWKQQALAAADKIHSRGLYSDLENALWNSTAEWLRQEASTTRSLILLTDGVIDIANDIDKSNQSRTQILTDLLPLLQKAGVNIHTIALSKQADMALLKKLSLDTNGWNKAINSAPQLQRSFLEMFNKAEPHEILPIIDNKFVVDVTINEISVLIFKKAETTASKLITPDGKAIEKGKLPDGAIWLDEIGYALITVKNPMPGEWRIDAGADTDNQVMIMTDLQMKSNQLPNQIVEQDAIAVTVHFVDNGNLITRNDFLSILKLTVRHEDAAGNIREWPLSAIEGKTGYFSYVFDSALPEGINTITIKADGKTFIREIKQTIEVANNPILVETMLDNTGKKVIFTLTPDHYFIDLSTVAIKASVNSPPAEPETVATQVKDGRWSFSVGFDDNLHRKIVNFSATAKTLAGKKLNPEIKPVIIDEVFLQSLAEQNSLIARPKEKVSSSGQKNDTNTPGKDDKTANNNEQEQNSDEAESSWLKTGAFIVLANILVFGGGFFAYRWYRKKSLEKQEGLLNKLSS